MRTLTFIKKYTCLLHDVLGVTQGQTTTSCLQLFGIFIMLQKAASSR